MVFFIPAPSAPEIAMASRMEGKAKKMSTTRIISRFRGPPTKPAMMPSVDPARRAMSTVTPATRDMRPPYKRRLSMSRPCSSVPST